MSNFKSIYEFYALIFFAICNTGFYLLMVKWHIIDYYNFHRRSWMPHCSFCLFFWMALVEITFLMFGLWAFKSAECMLFIFSSSIFAATISRKML